jgi:hypothetical protein
MPSSLYCQDKVVVGLDQKKKGQGFNFRILALKRFAAGTKPTKKRLTIHLTF